MGIETLTERADYLGEGVAVDREAGVIRGVKILGLTSRNGRTYLREAVGRAKSLYEGATCKIDHRAKPTDPRVCNDSFGEFRAVEQRADGCLYADLHYLKSHAMADRVCEAAERKLHTFGMSHDVKGKTSNKAGNTVVEEIVSVASVDLVADAATTKGLFESKDESNPMEIAEQLAALKGDVTKLTADLAAVNTENTKLKEQIATAEKDKTESDRKTAIAAAFVEFKVDPAKVPAGLRSIIESQSVEQAKIGIKDWAESHKTNSPTSTDSRDRSKDGTGGNGGGNLQEQSTEDWAKELTR